MTVRKQQIESTLKRLISHALQARISDPRIAGLVSITRIDLSPDHAQARVFVSVMPQQHERRTIAGLRSGAGHIASLVRPQMHMRRFPRLVFELDDSLKKQAEVMQAIREGLDLEGPAPGSTPGNTPGNTPENDTEIAPGNVPGNVPDTPANPPGSAAGDARSDEAGDGPADETNP